MNKMADGLVKDFGENIILDANNIIQKKQIIIPVSPCIDMILGGGIPEGSFVTLTGQPKCGKSLANSSVVYTPSGPKAMGDLKINELVCTPNGDIAKIIGVYPQGELDIYEVSFNDGSKARCSLDHNWTVAKNNRRNQFVTISLSEIISQGIRYNDRFKWKIQLTKPVEFEQAQSLTVDPYIFGCLLGDGGLSTRTPRMSTKDRSIRDRFKRFAIKNKLKITKNNPVDFSIVEQNKNTGNVLTKKLKELNLMGTNSHTKFIPNSYKYSSITNRFSLIRGLMDTDGSNDKGLRAEYTTTSIVLANDVKEVLQSLGYTAKIVSRHTTYTGSSKKFLSYRLYIHGDDVNRLFNLSRKKYSHTRTKPSLFRTIVDIQKVSREQATCIKIDTNEGLFLTNDFIVTHNTVTSLDFAATAQDPKYGKDTYKDGRNVYYLNIEGRIKPRDLQGIPHLNREKFHIIGSQQGNILSAEKFLQIAYRLINEEPGCVIIIDSYSALCTETELTNDMDKMQRADGAKLLAKFCRKSAGVIPVNNNIVIGITHLMANPGMGYSEWKEKSGQAIGYQGDVKLRAKYHKPWTLTADGNPIGQEVEWTAQWNALSAPGGETTSYIRYGQGIDKCMELAKVGEDLGLIEKKGAWYTLTFLGEDAVKFQGSEKIRNYLSEHADAYIKLDNEIKNMLGFQKEL